MLLPPYRWMLAPTQLLLHGDHRMLSPLYLRQAITINELMVSPPLDPADRLAAVVRFGDRWDIELYSGQLVVVLCGKSHGS